jgi:preprotein translocase subunit SecG
MTVEGLGTVLIIIWAFVCIAVLIWGILHEEKQGGWGM